MKAIALISGGLDSTLATKLIKELGIEIIGLNFKTPFCLCDGKAGQGCFSHSRRLAQSLGIEFRVINVTDDFLEVVRYPKHGYGSNMNPCIDCRILKFSKAREFMQEAGAAFIITGEVVGQRPMSQQRHTLNIIDRESGLQGLVLRPLSAKILPETIPEKEGWIARERLLALSGRTRKPQIELAKKFGIKDYPCPAGGCLLTDPGFSGKIRDLMKHGEFYLNNIELLKTGRHFRLNQKTKLIVGRNEKENLRLSELKEEKDWLFMPQVLAGPTALGRGEFDNSLLDLSCGIVSRYCDLNGSLRADIICRKDPRQEVSSASPCTEERLATLRI